ncbi:MAG: restriction endonuclease FokI C-terminal domain-containing protein [Clostridia bacterium]
MINILPTHVTSFRAFGWIQDPSNFRSLCDVVAIFDENSDKHSELKERIIPNLISEIDGQERLLSALDNRPLKLLYTDLVGTSFMPRSTARCNGIVQATVKGQKRSFISDWPADNFIRWAHAFGFISYNYSNDTFQITETGLQLTNARTMNDDLNENEKEILISAILAYPPAVRILNLLNETEYTHLTKFEIGKQLGFVGEDGFTSLPQSILLRQLAVIEDKKEKNKMKTDWEGSSDKYARMTAKWLAKLGLVEQVPKSINVEISGDTRVETIGQSYRISANGITALNRTIGRSRYRRISKNVCFEMLATKGNDREYLRTRRAYVLKFISENNSQIRFCELLEKLCEVNFNETIDTIKSDVNGLINLGLNISLSETTCKWNDKINDFTLPLAQRLTRSTLTEIKEELRPLITHISHEYLSLIDLAYDSSQNRLFEMKTLELLLEECDYKGLHLGGSRKPDGVIYSDSMNENYGIIIDTKAYSNGYSLPISQADEMERYIRENDTRDISVNPNQWWLNFDENINKFYFMFISGHFTGNYISQLERLTRTTNRQGTSLNVKNLILCANLYKSGNLNHSEIERKINDSFDFTC